MYWITGCIWTGAVVLLCLSGKESADEVTGILKPFYRAALYVYKRLCVWKVPILGSERVQQDLSVLHPGEGVQLCTQYYVKKLMYSMLIILFGSLFAVLIHQQEEKNYALREDGTVLRGEGLEQALELEIISGAQKGERFTLQVQAREMTGQEALECYEEFANRLPELILGNNASLQRVTERLWLEESYEDYPFTVEWSSNREEVLTSEGGICGKIMEEEEVLLTAYISYGENSWEEKIKVVVFHPELSDEEERQQIEKLLTSIEEESRQEETMTLPGELLGERVTWRQVTAKYSVYILPGTILTAVLIFFLSDKDLHDGLLKRRASLKREYPEILQQLILYLGAGLTVRGALFKLAAEDKREKKEPVYEELCYICREMQAGVSENAAYEHLGVRTGLPEYIHLSTLLAQNLKKGNSTLLQRLKEEADKAYMEQQQSSRKLGEEAATKLLLPMVLMLLVVMLMIMIPAFSSVGISG